MRSSGKPKLGLIGYGRFGRLAAGYLRRWFDVAVADSRTIRRAGPGVRTVSLRQASRRPIVVLAVPVNKLKGVLRRIAPHLPEDALVFDACAVKTAPMRWMAEILPSRVEYVGTHPLFGPDSAAHSLRGHTIVLCPGRIRRATLQGCIRRLRAKGLRVVVTTPARHDRFIARTLFLPQFVGRALGFLDGHASEFQTPSSRRLLELVAAANKDSEELLRDLFRYDPDARKAARLLAQRSRHLLGRLR